MRRCLCVLIALLLSLSAVACAEGSTWVCPNDGIENTGKFCTECGTPRPAVEVAVTWTCPSCGTEGLTGAYCTECGAPRPAQAQAEATAKCEGEGYATADDAARAYVEAMNDGDIAAMLSTFAVETYIDRKDAAASLNWRKSFEYSAFASLPVVDPFSRGLLIERRRNEITQSIYCAWLLYSTYDTDFAGAGAAYSVSLQDEAETQAFLSVFEASPWKRWIGHIAVTAVCGTDDPRVLEFVPETINNEANQKNLAKQQAICGADELVERVVFMDVDGTQGAQLMQCARYGNRWYNLKTQGLTATLLGMAWTANGMIVGEIVQ